MNIKIKKLALLCVSCFSLTISVQTSIAMELKSSGFKEGEFIPKQYTGEGEDISPPLFWSDVPEKVKSFVLICDDPDAPFGDWVHWLVYNISAEISCLQEAVPNQPKLAEQGICQGKNSFGGKIGYGGPMPPAGKIHRYFFKIYALDSQLNLPPGLTKKEILENIKGHILAQAQLIGRYKR